MITVIRRLITTAPLPFLLMASLYAQQDRISARIDDTRRVTLRGNVNPLARPEFDQGAVDPSFNLRGIMLVLKQSATQQSAINQLLEQQQDQTSPKYHKWLTPQQYADQFGMSPSDIAKITAWLKSEGFTVDEVANGRNWIRFSGTAAQVKSSFETELHRYIVNGEQHFANATEPAIPAALQDIVGGIRGLDDFRPKPRSAPAQPEYTVGTTHYLVPDDLATIYDIQKLYSAGIDGTGQKIVVVGQTNVYPADIASFRSMYGLSAPNLQIIRDTTNTDPGYSAKYIPEADLDIEWSGGIAKNATILFVYSESAFDAVAYAINNNLAPVISMSFGRCEQADLSFLPTVQSWAQQANLQGTTWFAASGDTGAADCDHLNNSIAAQAGLSVEIPAVVPEVTGVGGTEFDEGGANYWSAANDANGGSALSYIPEIAWNDSSPSIGLLASGGGVST
ncbi:MAG: protease pro-enzyme activation domain-containing protein, partial [Bryobacteraceae bacterium]